MSTALSQAPTFHPQAGMLRVTYTLNPLVPFPNSWSILSGWNATTRSSVGPIASREDQASSTPMQCVLLTIIIPPATDMDWCTQSHYSNISCTGLKHLMRKEVINGESWWSCWLLRLLGLRQYYTHRGNINPRRTMGQGNDWPGSKTQALATLWRQFFQTDTARSHNYQASPLLFTVLRTQFSYTQDQNNSMDTARMVLSLDIFSSILPYFTNSPESSSVFPGFSPCVPLQCCMHCVNTKYLLDILPWFQEYYKFFKSN